MLTGFRTKALRPFSALSLLLALGACGLDGALGQNEGRVRLTLARDPGGAAANLSATDGAHVAHDDDDDGPPAWSFTSASVTLSSVMLRTLDGVLVPLDIALPVDVDVVRIEGGRQVQLPDGILPVGEYDQVVLVMTAVRGTTNDGAAVTVEPPGGGWTAVVPICPLEVVEGGTANVAITLNVRRSFLRHGGWWSFQPRFASRLDCETN